MVGRGGMSAVCASDCAPFSHQRTRGVLRWEACVFVDFDEVGVTGRVCLSDPGDPWRLLFSPGHLERRRLRSEVLPARLLLAATAETDGRQGPASSAGALNR